jgi:hypothetical protein
MLNTAVAILKGDSLTSYEAAMEDNCTNPDDKSLMVPMTEQHIDDALLAATNQIFPYCALKTQKQWISKYARKPYKMGAKQFVILMSRINNYILFFPNATVLSKYSEEELLNILEFAVPPHWRKAFDLRDYLFPQVMIRQGLSASVSASNKMKRPWQKSVTAVTMTARATKKKSLQNLRKVSRKVARKQIRSLVLCIAPTARRTRITKGAAGS